MSNENEKVSKIELALERFSAVQEIQTAELKKLVEMAATFHNLNEIVKEHHTNIFELYRMQYNHEKELLKMREEFHKEITDARSAISKASMGRFILAVSMSFGLSWRLYEIHDSTIDDLVDNRKDLTHRVIKLEDKDEFLGHNHISGE